MESQRQIASVGATIARVASDRRGGVAIEFAFVIPIAILLTLGSVEVARAVSVQASISQAAKETVRFASVRGSARVRVTPNMRVTEKKGAVLRPPQRTAPSEDNRQNSADDYGDNEPNTSAAAVVPRSSGGWSDMALRTALGLNNP